MAESPILFNLFPIIDKNEHEMNAKYYNKVFTECDKTKHFSSITSSLKDMY